MFLINYDDFKKVTVRKPAFSSMAFEIILLVALIIIFIVSFCGLLQKIKQTYEREQQLAENAAAGRGAMPHSLSEIYINPTIIMDEGREGHVESGGVFPGSPPPYTQYYTEPPPSYDDIIKDIINQPQIIASSTTNNSRDENVPATTTVSTVSQALN